MNNLIMTSSRKDVIKPENDERRFALFFDEPKNKKHPKCKGGTCDVPSEEYDFSCGYETTIECDECKYGVGRKDPEAKCNQSDES